MKIAEEELFKRCDVHWLHPAPTASYCRLTVDGWQLDIVRHPKGYPWVRDRMKVERDVGPLSRHAFDLARECGKRVMDDPELRAEKRKLYARPQEAVTS